LHGFCGIVFQQKIVTQNIVDNKFAVQFAQDFQKQMRKSELK